MAVVAKYRPWISLALAIAGVRYAGEVPRHSWLYPLLREIARDIAEAEQRPHREVRIR